MLVEPLVYCKKATVSALSRGFTNVAAFFFSLSVATHLGPATSKRIIDKKLVQENKGKEIGQGQ